MGVDERLIRLLALTTMLQKDLDVDGAPTVTQQFKAELSALILQLRDQLGESSPQLHLVPDDDPGGIGGR
jgi:hypothetical protein